MTERVSTGLSILMCLTQIVSAGTSTGGITWFRLRRIVAAGGIDMHQLHGTVQIAGRES